MSKHQTINAVLRALAVCFFVLATSASGAVEIQNVIVQPHPRPISYGQERTYHGYREIRLTLTNRHPTATRTVRLALPGEFYDSSGHHLARISQSIVIAPGTSTDVSLFQPALTVAGDMLEVRINGDKTLIDIAANEHQSPSNPHWGGPSVAATALLSRSVRSDYRDTLLNTSGSSSAQIQSVFQSEQPIEQWSGNWLGYSRYDGIFLTQPDIDRAPAHVADALSQYVAAGGTLIILGSWTPPPSWNAQPAIALGSTRRFTCGFGVIFTTTETDPLRLSATANNQLQQDIRKTLAPFETNRSIEDANEHFDIVGELRIPVRGLLILIIVFAVFIGPVNLYILAKKNKRLWLLWTVPAVSLVTCLVIWIFNLLAEGVTPQQRSAIITLLDQRTLTATSLGWIGYYAPLTPGDGLRFSRQTELTPQIGAPSTFSFNESGWGRTMNWGDDQHLSSGWIKARLPSHFMIRDSQNLVRQRLSFTPQPDRSIKVVNGLGVHLRTLAYADDQGTVYLTTDLPAGESRMLQPDSSTADSPTIVLRELYAGDWVSIAKSVAGDGRPLLDKGRYVAVIDGPSPFVAAGLARSEHRALSIVIGQVEPISAESEASAP